MHVHVSLRDVFRDAIAFLHAKFPDHTIIHFAEVVAPDALCCAPIYAADCYGEFPIGWKFYLEKEDMLVAGPGRLTVTVNPLEEIVFPHAREDTLFQIDYEDDPKTIQVAHMDASILNGCVLHDVQHKLRKKRARR